MIILDTDCLSLIERGSSEADLIIGRLETSGDEDVATTIINFEEQMRGWLAFVAKARTLEKQLAAYSRLSRFVENYRNIPVLPFEEIAANQFRRLRESKLKIATMDLKIASITLANDALLITRNLSDFEQVPNLRVADWTLA